MPTTDQHPHEAPIRELIERWAHGVRSRNIDEVLADHSDDIRLFDVPPPAEHRGIDAYRTSWTDEFFPWHGSAGSFIVDQLEVTAGDDVAFANGIIHCRGEGEADVLVVRLTVGLRRIHDRWTVTHEHHSEPIAA